MTNSLSAARERNAEGVANQTEIQGPVLVVVPALNEEHYIQAALDSLIQGNDGIDLQVMVLDGGSTDRTVEIVTDYARKDARVSLHNNPDRLQAAAVNRAARFAAPDIQIIVRADCHAHYPSGFVAGVARSLVQTGVSSVVVPMVTEGRTCFQKAVAAAQNSVLGNGGSSHRRLGESRFVDHGHHAAFDRAAFIAIGGYDESFSHNEDAEFDLRLNLAGGRIWLDSRFAITYFPRTTLRGLARQYFNHGSGRAKTFWKHRPPLKLRQLALLSIFPGISGSLGLALISTLFLFPPLAYASLCCLWGAAAAVARRDLCLMAMGPAAITMHLSWGWGFVARSLSVLRGRS